MGFFCLADLLAQKIFQNKFRKTSQEKLSGLRDQFPERLKGLSSISKPKKPIFELWGTIVGHFENYFEKLGWSDAISSGLFAMESIVWIVLCVEGPRGACADHEKF